ncbi:rhomboid family intramembrane serine protease [Novipirellula artificiosorum]|uniref:Rhomboid protease GlpG n=1 Tax=Novipirellula artificiosorum TaxID=2528016 RepID=A0A5C6DXR9_9BACT|nr:rhomboid family intramembrane serine protease [Novipirellula artificiosorum]TWU41034.1 Rhomboid protease GlpG [Novipirellula artificiosorum]
MRRIGTLSNEALAQRFCDFLVTLAIDAATDSSSAEDGAPWDIWIRDEKDVEQAREELVSFEASPDAERYNVKMQAATLRNKQVEEQQRRIAEQRKLHRKMPATTGASGMAANFPGRQQKIPVTIAVIAISVVAGYLSYFGRPRVSQDPTKLTTGENVYYTLSFVDDREYAETGDPFASIRKGQLWRLVTPMFLHGSTMHLAFNMIMLFMLGSAIERLQGSVFFGVLLIATQIAGMMLQVMLPGAESLPEFLHAMAGTPRAIGASGAVFGLFGYLWIRPTLDPSYPIHMPPSNVMLMLGWLVLCMTGMVGNIANGAHLGGLLAGMAAAYFVAPRDRV